MQEFVTTRQGYRLATSTGGVLTGRGADIIAIDDPLKRRPPDTAQLPPVLDWQERLVCSQCGSREIDMVLPVLSGGA